MMRTIDTAKRENGKWIVAWRPPNKDLTLRQWWQSLVQVFWSDEDEAWVWPTESSDYGDPSSEWFERGDYYRSNDFTHWMEMPNENDFQKVTPE